MSDRMRVTVFLIGAALVAWVFGEALLALPPLGSVIRAYPDLLNHVVVAERHATDVVTAVNFDYRALDTLGEESILFASVVGVLLLLRIQPDEHRGGEHDALPGRQVPPISDAVRVTGLLLLGPLLVFGLDIMTHGQVTPGGGFQGGVIVATAVVLVYLSGSARFYEWIARETASRLIESIGILAYTFVGAVGLMAGGAYLQNVLPLGRAGTVFSGGTIAVLSIATGFAVTGGFLALFTSFLQQTLQLKGGAHGSGGGRR